MLKGLTDTEIYGNLFLYNFAGHEWRTAAYFLRPTQKWQDWLAEEIEFVFGDQTHDQVWAYNQFPRLKRYLAIMVKLTESRGTRKSDR